MKTRTVERLLSDVAWALEHDLPDRDLTAMLESLRRSAPRGSSACLFAELRLAERKLQSQPFRAAVFARSVAMQSNDHQAWGLLGLALTRLGEHRAAVRAFRRALAVNPRDPAHAHNLGHVLDVAFDRPRQALGYLERAHRAEPEVGEIAASYAHALARVGARARALELLIERAGQSGPEAEATLARWEALLAFGRQAPMAQPTVPVEVDSEASQARATK